MSIEKTDLDIARENFALALNEQLPAGIRVTASRRGFAVTVDNLSRRKLKPVIEAIKRELGEGVIKGH